MKVSGLAEVAEVEVFAKAQRRRFTAEYKGRILEAVENCKAGEIGALLRREGLYSSHVATWKGQRERGELGGKKRGRKARPVDARDREIAELKKQLARQAARAEKAEAIVDIQKKLGQLFGVQMPESPEPTRKR